MECLNYPFDSEMILRKKKSLKRALLSDGIFKDIKVAILGGSTTNEIKDVLELFLLKAGFLPIFYQSEFNKYYEDAIFGNDILNSFSPDIIYIHTTNRNILRFSEIGDTASKVEELINDELKRFNAIWKGLERFNCIIIQNNFELPFNRDLGNLDGYDIHGRTYFVNALNMDFANSARKISYLMLNDIHYLSAFYGLQNWSDKNLWYTAKYALSFDAIPLLANNLVNIINASFGKTKKCLVLDLDNTCWGGIIGDDGLNGIKLGGETAVGESYVEFQSYVKRLNDRGILLAVCSKNELEIAKEGFTHSDCVLKFDDFTSFKANWEPKHENIKAIANEINIGIDSLVFIDDNPVEREIVQSQLPFVSIPNENDIINFIDHIEYNGYFEVTNLSKEDVSRVKLYKENANRDHMQAMFANYDEFLVSLNMLADIHRFDPIYYERITQLINKTNQFNLTTKRYTIADVEKIADNNNYIALFGKLSDKFGDNGIISIIIGMVDEKVCRIDSFLMSCRVLKRQMEHAMLDVLVEECKLRGVNKIIGSYIKTAKNNMVSTLYSELGFDLVSQFDSGDTNWELSLEQYNKPLINIKY